jgi:hypothetical protein
MKKGTRFPWRPQTDQQFEKAYLVAASAGMAVVLAAALLVRLCLTFLAVCFTGFAVSVGVAAGAATAIVVAGAAFAVATGACAKEATATPDKTAAAIRDLIFIMVQYSLIYNSRISSDYFERPNSFAGLAITT